MNRFNQHSQNCLLNFLFSYGVTGSRDSDQALIGFDMGGTSTDVSRFADGKYEHVVESTTAGITIQASQLDINTVAAGGGSMLFFRSGLFVVGPESASGNSIHHVEKQSKSIYFYVKFFSTSRTSLLS